MQALDPLRFPLAGRRLIEASAGTGKTFTIAMLYLRLLLEARRGVDEILVVTFTKAATAELRGRIRARIRDLLDLLDGRCAEPDGLLLALLDWLDEPREALRQRLADALTRMDEAAVFTIHGFAQRVLAEHAFESGAPFEAEFLDDEQPLRLAVVEDFWRQRCAAADTDRAAWLRARWKTPRELLKTVAGWTSRHGLGVLPQIDAEDLQTRAVEVGRRFAEARESWGRSAGEVVEALVELREKKHLSRAKDKYAEGNLAAAVAEMEALFAADGPRLALSPLLALFTPERLAESMLGKRDAPSIAFFDAFGDLWQAHQRWQREGEILLLRELLAALESGLAQRKSQARQLAFDDLLASLHRALAGDAGPVLAAALRDRYPVALIDEFQDTDPLQYAIFDRIYAADPDCGLFMIGDPKQAIYAFRGADIFTYLQARDDTDPAGRYTLGTNYRSASRVVAAVNAVFAARAEPFLLEEGIDFQPVAAAPKADEAPLLIDGQPVSPLAVWLMPCDGRDSKKQLKQLSKKAAQGWFAAHSANEIARLIGLGAAGRARLGEAPLQARDLAVLVRNHFEAAAIQQALRALGVASVYYSRDSVYASEEAEALAHLLAAVAEPASERRLRSALAGHLLGASAEQLAALAEDEAQWARLAQRFVDYHEDWRRHGLLAMLHRLIAAEGVVARLLGQPGGERRLTNLLQLGELLALEAEQRPGASRLLARLAQLRAEADGNDEAQQLRLESDEGLVKIVTIHKSKGLEYPLVFLPFIWSARDPLPKLADGRSGAALFHGAAGGIGSGALLDLGSVDWSASAAAHAREQRAEELRLLYVALTRAAHRLYLGWSNVNDAEHSALAYLLHGDDAGALRASDTAALRAAWQAFDDGRGLFELAELPEQPRLSESLPPPASASASDATAPRARPFGGHIERDWCVTSYSALVLGAAASAGAAGAGGVDDGAAGDGPAGDPDAPDHDALNDRAPAHSAATGGAPLVAQQQLSRYSFPRGARAGVFLHALLEKLDFTAGEEAIRDCARRSLPLGGFDEQWADTLGDWTLAMLDAPLDAHQGPPLRLRDVPRRRRRDELEFHFPLAALDVRRLRRALAGTPYAGDAEGLEFAPLRGFMKGFIDLIFEQDGRYFVADYKSNQLGDRPADYVPAELPAAMAAHRYPLQYLLYSLALHRYLRCRLPGYDYARHFGGVYYLFLRGLDPARPGCGVFFDRPPAATIGALDALFAGEPAA